MSTLKSSRECAVMVIPTYNEAANIGRMIDYLNTKTFPSLDKKWDIKILVVDDSSPDGTAKIVEEKIKKYSTVHLLTRAVKTGLGSAYLDGFKYAMEKLKADFIFEFDADFQHPPETIPSMLEAMDDGYDYVIGSRKIKGGAEPQGRDFMRMMMTELGGFAARFILFFPFKHFWDLTDPTTGLKVTRVKGFVDHLDLTYQHLYSRKFGYKVQLLSETLALGAKFKEVPLKFANREAGNSKFESDTTKEILLSCIKTRWYEDFTQKFVKFAIVGSVGFIINTVGAKLFKNALLRPDSNISFMNGLCNALAAEISIISNFTFNNAWTFSKEKITSFSQLISKFLTFNLSSVLTGIIIPSVVIALLTSVFGDHLFIFQVIAIFGLTIPLNWLVYNNIIWKKK
ncbi:MAG: glycosyltransferase [Candidatus Shapirobacteria bacterium]|jgi:dolichol-phosphate mannosyltransferase